MAFYGNKMVSKGLNGSFTKFGIDVVRDECIIQEYSIKPSSPERSSLTSPHV